MDNFNDSFLQGGRGTEIKNPALGETLNSLLKQGGGAFFSAVIPNLVGLAYVIGVLIFFFMLITGAIQWISSGGDKQALESARGKLSNALVGIIILFSAFAVIKVIETFFGINILTIDIGPLVIQ